MRIILVLGLLLMGCKGESDSRESTGISVIEIDATQLPQRSNINSRASEILKDWPAFQEMETSFDALYRVENNEDLILVLEEMVKRQNDLEDSKYPEVFDIPQVKLLLMFFITKDLKNMEPWEYGK